MLGRTHIVGGLATAAVIGTGPVGIAASVFGSLLPDIDHPTSKIGKKVPILPHFMRHRGFTHSLLFVGLVYAILVVFFGKYSESAYPEIYMVIPGMLSHILLDMLNRQGVQLLFPFSDKIKIPIIKIKTGGAVEWLMFFMLLSVSVAGWAVPKEVWMNIPSMIWT